MAQGARAFFSYSRDDSDFALKLAGDLKAAGASVWLDQVDITLGDRWDRAVEAALTDCPRLLVILSPASVNSTNVMDEVSFALEERKIVIPVIYRDCTVPFRLRRVQHVDFRQDYARGLQELLRRMPPEQGAEQRRPAIPEAESQSQPDVSGAEEHRHAVEAARLEDERRKAAEQEAWEKAEQERRAQEQAEAERLAAQRAEQARINGEKVQAERFAVQKAAAERAARNRDRRERLDRERSEAAQSERLAQEEAAQERQRREKAEAEQKAKATAEVSAKATKPGASRKKYLALIAAVVMVGVAMFLLPARLRVRMGLAPKRQLVLQVQVQDAIRNDADQSLTSLRDDLQKARIDFASVGRNDLSTIAQADTIRIDLKGIPRARQDDLHSLVSAKYSGWTLLPVTGTDYALSRNAAELAEMKRDTVDRTLAVIQSRIEALGLEGRAFRQSGGGSAEYEIVVQLWGGPDDVERAKRVLLAGGRLEITLVVDGPFVSQENALAKYGGVLPLNSGLARTVASSNQTWYLLSRTPVITGRDFRSVHAFPDATKTGGWEIYFTLNSDGAHRFARFTGLKIGNRLAIVLNNEVRIVNTIRSQIKDSGVISGLSSEQEANDLVVVLRNGELPAGVAIVKEQ